MHSYMHEHRIFICTKPLPSVSICIYAYSVPSISKKKEAKGFQYTHNMNMAQAFKVTFDRYKPHLIMVVAQISYAILHFITEAAFHQGLNPHVYVTFRSVLAGLVLIPFAYFFERKSRPKMTLALFLKLFLLSLIGVGLTMNMYFASLRYTSPTFLTAVFNTVSSFTFIIAIILRMEVVDVKSRRGIAKILGTLTSLAGVTTLTLYRGSAFHCLWAAPIHLKRLPTIHENWVKGTILTVASCISWATWYIMQAVTLKKYPAQLSLTAWMNCIGGALSAVFALFLQHRPAAWSIKIFGVHFWAITYSAIVCSGIFYCLQFWCMKRKGPVFVSMFSPLSTVVVAFLAYFILGEKLYVGSMLGGVIVIIGLYLLLWGKERDQAYIKTQVQEQSFSHSDGLEVPVDDLALGETEKGSYIDRNNKELQTV